MVSEEQMKRNIFSLAEQNSKYLSTEYNVLIKDLDSNDYDLVTGFRNLIRDTWKLSINLEMKRVEQFLNSEKYMNIYEVSEREVDEKIENGELAANDKESEIEQVLRSKLKTFYKSRITYDSLWEDGKKFKYAALNIGGAGICRFGPFCICFKKEYIDRLKMLAFVKMDSLKHYDHGESNDFNVFIRDLAAKGDVSLLAALKHQQDIISSDGDGWHFIVCNNEDFIEAVTVEELLISAVESVRVTKDQYWEALEFKLGSFDEEIAFDRNLRASSVLDIIDTLREKKITVEFVDEG